MEEAGVPINEVLVMDTWDTEEPRPIFHPADVFFRRKMRGFTKLNSTFKRQGAKRVKEERYCERRLLDAWPGRCGAVRELGVGP